MAYILQTKKIMKQLILIISFPLLLLSTVAAADIKTLYFYEKGCRWCERMDNVMNDRSIKSILQRNADIIRIDVYGGRKIYEMGMLEKDLAKKIQGNGHSNGYIFKCTWGGIIKDSGRCNKRGFQGHAL